MLVIFNSNVSRALLVIRLVELLTKRVFWILTKRVFTKRVFWFARETSAHETSVFLLTKRFFFFSNFTKRVFLCAHETSAHETILFCSRNKCELVRKSRVPYYSYQTPPSPNKHPPLFKAQIWFLGQQHYKHPHLKKSWFSRISPKKDGNTTFYRAIWNYEIDIVGCLVWIIRYWLFFKWTGIFSKFIFFHNTQSVFMPLKKKSS